MPRDVVTDLERLHSNVGPDRDHQLIGFVTERTERVRNHAGHRAAPPRMHRGDVTAWRMAYQDGNAVGRPRCNCDTRIARDQRIPLHIGNDGGFISQRHRAGIDTMNLALCEQCIGRHPQRPHESPPVLTHGGLVVSQMKAQVESIEGDGAHAADAGSEDVTKAMRCEERGLERIHNRVVARRVCTSPSRRLEGGSSKSGQGVGWLHRFPSVEWTEALKIALNSDRGYREAGKAWTFGSVAMIVRAEPTYGLELDAGIILDVHEGQCRDARFVEGESDPEDAEFVIVGTYARWRDVIEGRLDPIKGMMEGKLKLARGHLPTIIRFVEPSRIVVASARKVPTLFPD